MFHKKYLYKKYLFHIFYINKNFFINKIIGNICCYTSMKDYEKNVYLDSDSFNPGKNEFYIKKSMSNSLIHKSKDN